MLDPVPFLQKMIHGQKILWVVVFDRLQRAVFPFLRERNPLLVDWPGHDGLGDLDVGVVLSLVAEDEVDLEISDPADAGLIAHHPRVAVHDILQHGAVVDSIVYVACEVEAEVG